MTDNDLAGWQLQWALQHAMAAVPPGAAKSTMNSPNG
jgi:hypothetical protein